MKKFLFILFGVFAFSGAFAAGENVPTSKSYVDAAVATKQDIIPANDGAARVLTNTGTAGEYGTKGIYNANGEYAAQTQNLVDAATMNAGVQNAIDSEFQCIEWLDPNDHTSDCLLLQLGGITQVPAGYTALEYLESTGTQWIDTGIYFDYSKNFRVIGKAINLNLALRNVILGSFYSDYDTKSLSFEFGGGNYPQYSGHFRVWAGDMNNHMFSTESIPTNTEILYDSVYDSNLRKIDTTIAYNDTNQNIQFVISGMNGICQRTLRFFKDDRPRDDVAHPLRIGEHKIYKNDILVRNFIPARRNSDGVLGMYDTVTNTFFTNNGTGEFIAGPVVNLYLPAGQ